MSQKLFLKICLLQVIIVIITITLILQNSSLRDLVIEKNQDRYTATQAEKDKNYFKRKISEISKKCEEELERKLKDQTIDITALSR